MPVPSSLQPVFSLLRGRRTGRYVGAAMCVAVALLFELIEVPAFDAWMNMRGPDGGIVWIVRIPALGFVVAGAWLLAMGLRSRPEDEPLWRALVEKPESIVWVHAKVAVERRAYGATVGRSRFLTLMTTTGAGFSLEVAEANLDRVLDGLETYLPHATFGWTEERETKYRGSPESLRLVAAEAPYRGVPPQDAARLRPARGAPYGAGALLVAALLVLRIALSARGSSCGAPSAEPEYVPPVPVATATSPVPVATAVPTLVAPGDLVVQEKLVYYTVPSDKDLFARNGIGFDRRRIAKARESFGGIAVAGRAFYYVIDGALWTIPAPYETPVHVVDGLAGASGLAVAGKHAYVLVEDGVARVDLAGGDAARVAGLAGSRAHAIATDGARVFFAGDTLRMLDDRTGRATSPGPAGLAIGALAVCGTAIYFTASVDGGTALFSLDAPARVLDEVGDGRAIACDRDAVYWVDASRPGGGIRRRTRAGKTETLTTGVPYASLLAVDDEHVWFTVPGDLRQWDKPGKPR